MVISIAPALAPWPSATAPGITAAAAKSARHAPPRLPCFVALPEPETKLPIDKARWLNLLSTQTGCIDSANSRAEYTGRAGGLAAIGAAATAIAEGRIPFALAGGVDSFLDLYVMATLDMEGRIKSDVHLDGFIPGEAGAFLLLAM